MTLAHLSDTHLGFRSYPRTTPAGFNQREQDVLDSFRSCLSAIAERDPDVVVHAGDMFHVVRPSNATIVGAYQAVDMLQRQRKGKPFVLIGGNHDTPRMADSGNILRLFEGIPGVILRSTEAEFVSSPALDEIDLEVLCVPSRGLDVKGRPTFEPTGSRKYSLLVLHGMTSEALPQHGQLEVSQTRADRWTYVALGDYHVRHSYAANVCYSGSTDFTTTNIWDEAAVPKSWVWFDTESPPLEFMPIDGLRTVLDLDEIDAATMTPEDLDTALSLAASWDEEMPIVRQRVKNVFPEVRAKLKLDVQREIATRALHYHLVTSAPERDSDSPSSGPAAATIEESWSQHIDGIGLPANIDRPALKSLGLGLLEEVKDLEADPIEA